MTVRCPHCGSADTQQSTSVVTTTADVGALAGITASLSKALSKGALHQALFILQLAYS